MGPYAVETLDYGPGGALPEAGTVDLTPYMDRDTGDLAGNYVDAYLDYELDRTPLTGPGVVPGGGGELPPAGDRPREP